MNPTLGKAIAIGTAAIGVATPISSLYTSGQKDRGIINTGLHAAGATVVGGGIAAAGTFISGDALDIASKIATKAL